MTQTVACLLCKCEALSSNSSIDKNQQQKIHINVHTYICVHAYKHTLLCFKGYYQDSE
jgi:hypothetical protein